MRRCHWLRENRRQETWHNLVFVDTEADPVPQGEGETHWTLTFGWACHERTRSGGRWTPARWVRFDRPEDFWVWCERQTRPKVTTYVFCHNWAFDAPILQAFTLLPRRGWHLETAILDSPPVILRWRRHGRVLCMLDTLNWWRLPLKAIGASVGVEKLPFPPPDASPAECDRYCRRDVEILRVAVRAWLTFLTTHDLGSAAPTLAGQALQAFRHRFLSHRVLIDTHPGALQVARDSYHGGRTEVGRMGRIAGPIFSLDVNSMYPAVMRDELYPTVLRLYTPRGTFAELRDWTRRYAVCARVTLKTDRPRYATRHEGRLVFPIGEFETCLTTVDLVDALAHDEILSVTACALYDRAPLFRVYVEALYTLRADALARGATVEAWMLKLLLNSLYGKFGQRGQVWDVVAETEDLTVETWEEFDYDTQVTVSFRRLAGIIQRRRRDAESAESHPAIAAHVTAYARARLWTLREVAGREHVYYMDTDSLWTDQTGRDRLDAVIDPNALGALRVQQVYPWVEVYGAKDYRTPEGPVIKGVRASAEWQDERTVIQEHWSSLVGLLRRPTLDTPVTMTVLKRLDRTYHKGTVGADGGVTPLLFPVGGPRGA